MSKQLYRLCVQRIDPRRNMARFYAMSIEPTLFGDASLVRNWGRIGTRGQWRIDLFRSESEANKRLFALLQEKRRKGYKPFPADEGSLDERSLRLHACGAPRRPEEGENEDCRHQKNDGWCRRTVDEEG